MAYNWNPNAPSTYGPEPVFVESGHSVVSTMSQALAYRFRSTAAETIQDGYLYSPGVTDLGWVGMEVCAAGNEVPSDVQSVIIQPNGQSGQTGITEPLGFSPGGNPPPAAFNFVNNWPTAFGGTPGDTAQYLRFRAAADPDYGTGDARIDLLYGNSIPAGRRILAVEVLAHVAAVEPGSVLSVSLVTGAGVLAESIALFIPQLVEDLWAPQLGDTPRPINLQSPPSVKIATPPSGGARMWTRADVIALGGTSGLRLRFERVGQTRIRLYNAALRVWHCAENREAAGLGIWWFNPPGTDGLRWFPLRDATTQSSSWSKTVGDKTLIVRSLGSDIFSNPEGQIGWSWLRSHKPVNLDGSAEPGAATLDISSHGVPLVLGPLDETRVRPFALGRPDSTFSVDGQPYDSTAPLPIEGSGFNYGQSFTTSAGGGTYNAMRFLVRPVKPLGEMSEQLVALVRQAGNNTPIASGYMLPGELPNKGVEVGGGWWLVTLELQMPLTLTGSTQYYTAIGTLEPGVAWEVQSYWINNDVTTLLPGLSYGGSANSTISRVGNSVSAFVESDMPVLLLEAAAPVDDLQVVPAYQTLAALGSCDCETSISSAKLAWSASSDPEAASYEVQRRSSDDNVWRVVANVVDPAWQDFGFQRGIAQEWRVRVLRNDGTFSAWTLSNSETIGGRLDDPEIIISAGTGGLTVGFTDVGAGRAARREYDFLSADDVEYRRLHDRDYISVVRPPEYRGVQFTRTLLIQDCAPGCPGLTVLDTLKKIERADVEALTVIEECGDIYYAAMVIQSAQIIPHPEGGAFALVDIEITEVQGSPPVETQ